jgi:23S rRNA (cytidine1920-2'-O)/16S rRNA (cytidine1409-2'-O)-methyltransferase
MKKQRVDVALVESGLAVSRERAQALIMAGHVYIGENKVIKSSENVNDTVGLNLRGAIEPVPSRGSYKLEKAIQVFSANVQNTVAMDIGASTGGFTDVLLRYGAQHVYAIDVGYGQLDWRLRSDPRVTVMERTNARNLAVNNFPLHPDLAVIDVSFISIKLILPVAKAIMGTEGRFLVLIKPQFEAGRGQVGKNGVVRDAQVHIRVLKDIVASSLSFCLYVNNLTFSPIKGPKGNIEFLADIRTGLGNSVQDEYIHTLVNEAHLVLNTQK